MQHLQPDRRTVLLSAASVVAVGGLATSSAPTTPTPAALAERGWAVVTDSTWAGGAKGDGTTDDTSAVRAAASSGKALFFPPGTYLGAFDLDLDYPRIIGVDMADVVFQLEDGHFLVDSNQVWSGLYVRDITVKGGKGALRNRSTAPNVTQQLTVMDCTFNDYTGAAISHDAPDMPLWRVERCLFQGANHKTTMGVALGGLTDNCVIQSCEFQRNNVHIKLGSGGNNAYLANNDFVQYSPAEPGLHRTAIWVVPNSTQVNAGQGLVVTDNKLGNENLGTDDFRVAYADEGSGSHFGDRLPNFNTDSTGFIVGHTFRGGYVAGAGASGNAVVYSTTPNVRGCRIEGMFLAGSSPNYVLQVRTPSAVGGPDSSGNLIGPFLTGDENGMPLSISNQPSLVTVVDPTQTMDLQEGVPLTRVGGANAAGYVNVLPQRVPGFRVGGTTAQTVTDSIGGKEAIEVSLNSGGVAADIADGTLIAGVPLWVEFDVAAPESKGLTGLTVTLGSNSESSGPFLRRSVATSSRWVAHRLLVVIPRTPSGMSLTFFGARGASGSTVRIGRVRAYHAREPVLTSLQLPDVDVSTDAPDAGAAAALPPTPAGYLTVFLGGKQQKIAYY